MLKKRIIFTLLFFDGYFVLSRNFRLQKVGNLEWLKKNYNFKNIAMHLDELIILNVRPNEENHMSFCEHIKEISKDCFIPISAGGGVNNLKKAEKILKYGADKIVINSLNYNNPKMVKNLGSTFGNQCLIGSIDYKIIDKVAQIYINNGTYKINSKFEEYIKVILQLPIGEIYLNSIDKDGTGQGLDLTILNQLNNDISIPLIYVGGIGNWHHMLEGLRNKKIDAISTAHLHNFVNDGIKNARENILNNNINLPIWS